MTIDEVKEILENAHFFGSSQDDIDTALEMAIASLEAWDKVKWDIKALADYNTVDVLVDVMRIINKHMGEVKSNG